MNKAKPSTSASKSSAGLLSMHWNLVELLALSVKEEIWAIKNLVELIEDGCSVPFIARYRQEQTNHMEADKIREAITNLEDLRAVQAKAATAVKHIEKAGKMTDMLLNAFKGAQTMEEVEALYAPYKSGAKTTLAERARKLGLDPAAENVLRYPKFFQLKTYVKPTVKGMSTEAEVEKGIQHILIDIIAKDTRVLNKLRELVKYANVTIRTSKRPLTEENQMHSENYSVYFEGCYSTKTIRHHQVMAINRGETLKVLLVKVMIPEAVIALFKSFCQSLWVHRHTCPELVVKLLQASIDEACSKRLQPMIIREIRSNLTKTAEKASVDVFAQNLRRLLLTPPVRGKVVMAIDPGFRNGCKLAVTSPLGQILQTGVAYLHGNRGQAEVQTIVDMVIKHKCETIALGSGTACRETESILAGLIGRRAFGSLKVMYCIVNEDGASIYSVSPEAAKEMPDLSPNARSAVSIARRLQDPLVELVKIDPKHIGVGMYQHDIRDKLLKDALNGVVEECVSFVGIDLNVCSVQLLGRIAGMTATRAQKLIEFREKNGAFTNREQMLDIKGFGPKTYEQCAGFIRVQPASCGGQTKSGSTSGPVIDLTPGDGEVPTQAGRKRKAPTAAARGKAKKRKAEVEANPLDMTWVHPESYHIATKVISKAGADVSDIGTVVMKNKLQKLLETNTVGQLAEDLSVGEPTMKLVIEGLKQPMGYDIRAEYDKPLFKQNLLSVSDLRSGQMVTGRVSNMTHFGAFVDIGVGPNGLIHNSKMGRMRQGQPLGPGDKVTVKVLSVQKKGNDGKTRISLELVSE